MGSRRAARVAVSFLVGWTLLAAASEFLVPQLIRSAYRGESVAALNRMISGQREHSVDHYLELWRRRARPSLVVLAGLGLFAAFLSKPSVDRRLAAALSALPNGEAPDPVLPSPRRTLLVNSWILVLIGGSFVELVLDPPYAREHWPFSQYQMYSELHPEPTIAAIRLFGVLAADARQEMPLVENEHIQPFDNSRLWVSLTSMHRAPNREALLGAALGDCLGRYEDLRRAGRHDGPPLQGVRLYRLLWRADPPVPNAEPFSRELLYEVIPSTPK